MKLTYYRGQGGFKRRFLLSQDGTPYDLSLLSNPTVTWWFNDRKRGNPTKKSVNWDGTPQTANNNGADFNVPANFFDLVVEYESQIEVYDDGILVWHSDPIFLVEVLEPSGVHTDP